MFEKLAEVLDKMIKDKKEKKENKTSIKLGRYTIDADIAKKITKVGTWGYEIETATSLLKVSQAENGKIRLKSFDICTIDIGDIVE